MIPLSKTGDLHGCNYSHSPSIKHHLRPLDYDIGSYSLQRDVRMDHVESHVGTSHNTSDICDIQLSYSQHQGKD